MFHSRLKCGQCGYESADFNENYDDQADVYTLILQHRGTGAIRIVQLSGIKARLGCNRIYGVRDQEDRLDRLDPKLAEESIGADEERIDLNRQDGTGVATCPNCRARSITVESIGIL